MNDIITGYEKALEVAYKALDGIFSLPQCISPAELSTTTVSDLRDVSCVSSAILPVICAKQYGYEDVLARAIAEACLYTLPAAPATPKLDVDNVRTARLLGGSIAQTHMMPGMVLQHRPQNAGRHAQHAKVLVLTCGLEASSSETKGTVLLQSAQELLQFTRSEEAAFGDEIEAIAKTGVNVIFAGGSISEIARHFLNRFGIMGVSVGSKFDLRRLCKALGATALVRVGPPTAEEIGTCDAVDVTEIGGKKVVVLRAARGEGRIATVVVRGSTENLLEDVERAVDDGVNAVKTLCTDPRLCPGAGGAEAGMAVKVAAFGEECPGLDQYAVRKVETWKRGEG